MKSAMAQMSKMHKKNFSVVVNTVCLYRQCKRTVFYYTPDIYAEGYLVFVFPCIYLSVRMFIHSSICDSVPFVELLQSFTLTFLSSGVYLTNHSSESIPVWTRGTLEGQLSFHDSSPQGPCKKYM